MTIRVSFVIAARNEQGCIGKCLQSVMDEVGERKDIEIIVVDNGSTDATEDIVHTFPKVKLIYEVVPGLARTRKIGFDFSKGDLVFFLDADNELTPGRLTQLEKEFQDRPGMVSFSGPLIYHDVSPRVRMMVRWFYLLGMANSALFKQFSIVQGGNYVVRREALESIGGHNSDLTFYGEDTDIARRLRYVGEVRFSLGFSIRSSGRRLIQEGLCTMGLRYMANYFWIMFFKRPFTKKMNIIQQ
jgi:glycosyltransferase involved in cell wall biosynthesis